MKKKIKCLEYIDTKDTSSNGVKGTSAVYEMKEKEIEVTPELAHMLRPFSKFLVTVMDKKGEVISTL